MSVQKFGINDTGRDFVVGDIHGCFAQLDRALASVGFDRSCDRLFSVGDLVDRGPDSIAAMAWLDYPWFFAVRGNHEQMAINYANGQNHAFHYERNGGRWFINLDDLTQFRIAQRFKELPLGIEIETAGGTVGIVHAEVPANDWAKLKTATKEAREVALWERQRIEHGDTSLVEGIGRVYVGHTPLDHPVQLGNVFYIDTGAVFGRPITLVCITNDEVMQEAA